MIAYQPPSGTRNLLPLDVAQKYWIEERLEQVFQRWGYRRIITSTVENLDTLVAGGAIDRNAVIELQSLPNQRLGLRPELTASIARTAISRMAQVTYPQRLYYIANVFRRTDHGSHGQQQESYQAGLELIKAGSSWADAEVLLLLADCLQSLHLNDVQIILGDAGLTRSLLLPFPAELRIPVRDAIAHLDQVALENLPLPSELKARALMLLNLRGEPESVLQSLGELELTADAQGAVYRLKSLISLLRRSTNLDEAPPTDLPNLVLDLSLIQPFDYYTGLVFEVVHRTDMGCFVLGQGGRYDNLLGVFHPDGQSYPGIGFGISIEALHQTLLERNQLPEAVEPTEWLVVPLAPAAAATAFAYARTIRAAARLVRVEVHLDPTMPQAAIRAVAQARHINRIAWISEEGLPEIEPLH